VAYPWLQHAPSMCPKAVSSLRWSNGSLPDGRWLLAMSRIILSFTRKWTSCKGGSLRCSGQRAFQSSSPPNSIVLTAITPLHLPKHFSFDAASHILHSRQLWHLLCVGSSIFAGKQYTRSRLEWVPHPPASARLSRGRVWSAKLSLPLTSQQSLCATFTSHNIHLGAAPRLALSANLSSTLELEHLPFPSITTVAALQGFVSLFCTSQHHRCRSAKSVSGLPILASTERDCCKQSPTRIQTCSGPVYCQPPRPIAAGVRSTERC
jgi:hypothetical protein